MPKICQIQNNCSRNAMVCMEQIYRKKKVGSRFTLLPLYLAVCLSTADKQRRSQSAEHDICAKQTKVRDAE